MKIQKILYDAYSMVLYKNNIYIGGINELLIINEYDDIRKIKCKGKINVLKKYKQTLFLQEHQKELYIFNGKTIEQLFKGLYNLNNSIEHEGELLICKIGKTSIEVCSINQKLDIKCGLSEELYRLLVGNTLIKGHKTKISGYDRKTFKEIWKQDVSNMGVQFYGNEERKNELRGGLGDSIIPYKDRIIMALAGGQILSLYAKTGEICFLQKQVSIQIQMVYVNLGF